LTPYIIIGAAAFIIGVIIAAAIIAAAFRRSEARRRKRKGQPEKSKRKIEFSKLILALVLLPYFYAAYIGGRVVLLDTGLLPAYLAFIACPTAAAIGFYTWKARAENIIKIQKGKPEDDTKIYHEGSTSTWKSRTHCR
jgi:Na+/H+ antiporter NhaD/arsenite permease-like protein